MISRPGKNTTQSRAGLASALLCVLLGGCVSVTPPPTTSPPPASSSESPSGSATVGVPSSPGGNQTDGSPLAAYSLNTAEIAAIYFAEESLIGRCMGQAGFDYAVRPFTEVLESEQQNASVYASRLYGITDREVAAQYGYEPPPGFIPEERSERDNLSEAYLVTLIGVADPDDLPTESGVPVVGGCVGSVRSELGFRSSAELGVGGPGDLGKSLSVATWTKFSASTEWSDITADWVACMAGKGWSVTDPVFDRGDISKITEGRAKERSSTPSPREIELALADVTCKEETDLVGQLREANDRWQREAIEKRMLDLQENRQELGEVVRRANLVVEENR